MLCFPPRKEAATTPSQASGRGGFLQMVSHLVFAAPYQLFSIVSSSLVRWPAWGSTRASAASCSWGGTTPCISTGLGRTCWRAALWRGWAMGTNWSIGSSVWTWGRTSLRGWWSTGTGCPGRWWSLLLWRYSRPAWIRSSGACSRWPCFGRRVGLDDPQRSLPTLTILWFCNSVSSYWDHCPPWLSCLLFWKNDCFSK